MLTLLYRRYSRRSELVRDAVRDWLLDQDQNLPEETDVRELIEEASEAGLLGARMVEQFLHGAYVERPAEQLIPWERLGEMIHKDLGSTTAALEGIRHLVERRLEQGQRFDNLRRLEEASRGLNEARQALERDWPLTGDPEAAVRAAEAYRRGECQDVEDILRELQGDRPTGS